MRALNLWTLVSITVGFALYAGIATNTAFAVVTFSDGADQYQAGLDSDFGFANVGARGSASGVYLGEGWVLTAKHVGAGDIAFNGVTYHYEEGSVHLIENPSGYYRLNSTYTDLTLFRITEEPDLPSLTIATEPPSVGADLYLAGNGIKHEDALSYWTVNTSSWVWTETDATTQYWGYEPEGTRELNWGKNRVLGSCRGPSPSTHYLSISGTDIVAMKTRFDAQEPYEAQAVGGDSGGGAFYWDDEEGWVLAGIISCAESLPNSPTKAIAGAMTYSVDLSFYQDQILKIITPEADPAYVPGDINGDHVVDSFDATILAMHWNQTTTEGVCVGDLNGDGVVDGSDATILASNWMVGVGNSYKAAYNMEIQYLTLPNGPLMPEVPEPATWILLLFLGIGSMGWHVLKRVHR